MYFWIKKSYAYPQHTVLSNKNSAESGDSESSSYIKKTATVFSYEIFVDRL